MSKANKYKNSQAISSNLNAYEKNIKDIVCNVSNSNISWVSINKYKELEKDLDFFNRKILCVFNEHYFSLLLFREHVIIDIFSSNWFLYIINRLIVKYINKY